MATLALSTQPAPARPIGHWMSRHWPEIFFVVYGLWVWLPWLAPILMHTGWDGAGRALYFIYSFFCHQLPERSFFLFGQKTMYSLTEIRSAWQNTINPLILRKFIGNTDMGWKVAWSDRMISFYTSVWVFAVLWLPYRRKVKPLPWWGFALCLLPIALDGGTHAISDMAGIGQGFRDSNQWLAVLTNNILPASFYEGDALGSFNSWVRLITGPLAGLGIVWLVFPCFSQTEVHNRKLDELNYAKVLEQIKSQNPRSAG
jgi:uncharacterized membrane protein